MNKIEITKQIYAAALACDWQGMEKYLHPEFAIIESTGLPYAGRYEGSQGFQDIARTVFTFFDKLAVQPIHYMEGEDYVVAIVSLQGKGKKTGKHFDTDLLELFRFKDGLLIEIKPYYWDQQLIREI